MVILKFISLSSLTHSHFPMQKLNWLVSLPSCDTSDISSGYICLFRLAQQTKDPNEDQETPSSGTLHFLFRYVSYWESLESAPTPFSVTPFCLMTFWCGNSGMIGSHKTKPFTHPPGFLWSLEKESFLVTSHMRNKNIFTLCPSHTSATNGLSSFFESYYPQSLV